MRAEYLELLRSGHFSSMPHHYMRRERPMDYLLFWVLGGKGFVVTEGHRHQASAGDLFCLLKGKSHEYGSDAGDPWNIVWVHFDGSIAPEFVRAIRTFGGARIELGHDAEQRDRWMELVIFHLARGPNFEVRANTSLYALLGLIVYRLRTRRIAPVTANPFDVHRIQTYIHNHLSGTITLDDLARQVNLSTPHFTRMFRKLFDVSPMQYVLQARVAQACSLLTESSMPLKQIGAAVGCPDPYYFSRLFKKTTGMSPSAYRDAKRISARS
jgi:AraC-like DNA-binding protein